MTTVEKWRQTGLLDNLNEDQCDELASLLKVTVNRLYEDVPPYNTSLPPRLRKESEEFASMILPIVRRLYNEVKPVPNIHWIYDDFKRFYNEKKQLRQELWETAINKIDSEAEFTALYVDDVVNKLNNP